MPLSTRSAPARQKVLRIDPPSIVPHDTPIIVTIDGPAGTGKSSVAHALATRLGLDVLDTGAMYRAATAIAIDHHIDPDDLDAVVAIVTDADLHFDWTQDPPTILAWLKPLNDRIRDDDVNELVSAISAIGALRTHMVRKQRLIGQQHPRLVSEGRDQGSIVFPDAAVKFYLDASPDVRAARRAEQLKARGIVVERDRLRERILQRDLLDSTRADGPLICPDDAIRLDTTNLDFVVVVDRLEYEVRTRVLDRDG